ncbi:N-formylglutamate amidohydrolase [Aerolutibacter daejeonensis]|uniref:N-formylglutamate amidohydrolase n=1 Tax=Aerolutibacter daejeonensis TaxID=346181 RepID=UPI0018DDE59F|nr:N-formylglutamate amidohydrolase [Lysobacter daejeonensis]
MATAIHDGHALRREVQAAMALPEGARLREEDPFTGQAILDIPTHVIPVPSRFECDLNRGEADAIYATPEQAWGLDVWRAPPHPDLMERSLRYHRAFYTMMRHLLDDVAAQGPFVLLDVHSYNHRRAGPSVDATPSADAPDINIGTFSMPREGWGWLLDPLIDAMCEFDFLGRRLDVRENVAFQGKGQLTRFVHQNYPEMGCAIAIEFKKFFMDEWTGEPDSAELQAMRGLMTHVADTSRKLLQAHG